MSRPLLLSLVCMSLAAQTPKATVREFTRVLRTYPFSDPDPVPAMGRIYPYYRFDGYTDQGRDRAWKVVELENELVRIQILPEIGGKIWSAVEKSTGKPFIYDNGVVKFRDIALRGPWTSGGIEANYGIIGHTPNCATPVDYLTRANPDGSVSCFFGCLDLLTRSSWRIEVNLAPGHASFTTRSFWFNASPLEQPYYSWMNVGLKAAGNLQFSYPGNQYLGHEGEHAPWPVDPRHGDLSWYDHNDFGSYKSYHVFGRATEFFGAYWHDDDLGMGRWSAREDKLGKKIWIWGLSPQGMLWEQLLTDSSGQYVEVQSGRLFNQALEKSAFTPFKHRGFAPFSSDQWSETWFPVKGTKGMVKANPWGALNAWVAEGQLELRFYALQDLEETLTVRNGDRQALVRKVRLKAGELLTERLPWTGAVTGLRLALGQRFEYSGDPDADLLSRPLDPPPDFDWNSVQGHYLQGKEGVRQRDYRAARTQLQACLDLDRNYLPALVELALLQVRDLDYPAAAATARKALAIDTYDPGGNYAAGLAALGMARAADARDDFAVAAQAPEWRAAARVQLARMEARAGRLESALAMAGQSLETSQHNLAGMQLQALCLRRLGRDGEARVVLARLLDLDPLQHWARFEQDLLDRAAAPGWAALVRNEMPQQTFLELAAWYGDLGLWRECLQVLEPAPADPEVHYWRARACERLGSADWRGWLAKAGAMAPDLVFPFRAESAEVLDWAMAQDPGWQPRYYRALLHWSRGAAEPALALLEACGEQPLWAPFYATRAQLRAPALAAADLARAMALDPAQYRFGLALARLRLDNGDAAGALGLSEQLRQRFPGNYYVGLQAAKVLLRNGRYGPCGDLLAGLKVLPNEGATEGRALYKEARLMFALEAMARRDWDAALAAIAGARRWPENLGVGRPYPADLDERLEDWLQQRCLAAQGRTAEAQALVRRLAEDPRLGGCNDLVTAWALQKLGRSAEPRLQAAWVRRRFQGQSGPVPGAVLDENGRILERLIQGRP